MSPHNRTRQGHGIGTPDPRRTEPCTPGQVKRLRQDLEIIKGSETMLLALVYARTGRDGLNRLEDMNGFEAQIAFEIMNNQRAHRALCATQRSAGGDDVLAP